MIVVAAITLGLILVGVGAFIYGTVGLAKFAFRVSTGRGIAAILFPPYAFYFAFAELEEEGKNIPTASWLFGLVVTALLATLFFQPLTNLLAGNFDALATNPGDAARAEYGSGDGEESSTNAAEEDEADEPEEDESADLEEEGEEDDEEDAEDEAREADEEGSAAEEDPDESSDDSTESDGDGS